MTCKDLDAVLDDYVDGKLDAATAAGATAHLAGCPSCRELERGIRQIVNDAGDLSGDIRPRRDLWGGIEERISAPGGRAEASRGTASRTAWWKPVLAAAAVVILAGAALLLRDRAPAPLPASSAGAAGTVPAARRPVPDVTTRLAGGPAGVAFYEARLELKAAIEEHGTALSPATVKTVNANLKIIDDAIQEIQAAIDRDPANTELKRMLVATQQREVNTLRRLASTAALR